MTADARLPSSTYRLQFSSAFTFADAHALLPYLAALGITDCYSSPFLKANPGSSHGYDITDHRVLNPELGSDTDFESFCGDLRARGISPDAIRSGLRF